MISRIRLCVSSRISSGADILLMLVWKSPSAAARSRASKVKRSCSSRLRMRASSSSRVGSRRGGAVMAR